MPTTALLTLALFVHATPQRGNLPEASLDLGTDTVRIQVSAGPAFETVALVWGTRLLPSPRVIPWLDGLLELDVSSGEIMRNLTLDANGELDLSLAAHSFAMGEDIYLQAAILPTGGGAAISTVATDHVPMADGLYLNPDPENGYRVGHTVPEVVALPGGGVRLFFNGFGAMSLPPGIYSATSADGIHFQNDSGMRIAPPTGNYEVMNAAPLKLPDGRLRLYYLLQETSGGTTAEVVRSAVSDDWLNFVEEPGERWAGHADDGGRLGVPDVLAFEDSIVRLYYQGDLPGNNTTSVAISLDGGLSFTREATDILGLVAGGPGNQFVDADALRLPDGRVRIVAMQGGAALYSFSSDDGVVFRADGGGEAILGVSELNPPATTLYDPAQLLLDDGTVRLYFHTDNGFVRSALIPDETGRGFSCPGLFLCDHDTVLATSPDGLNWTHAGTYLEGTSVPGPLTLSNGQLKCWFVDGTSAPEHLGVFRIDETGAMLDVRALTIIGGPSSGSTSSGVLDPAPVEVAGQTWLYGTVLPFATGGIGRGLLDEGGSVLEWEGLVVAASHNFVDPDVVVDDDGIWHMWAFSSADGHTWHLTSTNGQAWSDVGPVTDLFHQGFSRPLHVGNEWWLYTFEQFASAPNDVSLYRSSDLNRWTLVDAAVYQDPFGRELTDAQVVADGSGGFLMIHKVD